MYHTMTNLDRFTITYLVEDDVYAAIIVADDQADRIQRATIENVRHFYVYTENKENMKELLLDLLEEIKGVIQVHVDDYHSSYMASCETATKE